KKAKGSSLYSLHPGFKMEEAYTQNLLKRTGKTLDEWVAFTRRAGPGSAPERRAWLKQQGLTTNYAWWISDVSEGKNRDAEDYDPDALVEATRSRTHAQVRTSTTMRPWIRPARISSIASANSCSVMRRVIRSRCRGRRSVARRSHSACRSAIGTC